MSHTRFAIVSGVVLGAALGTAATSWAQDKTRPAREFPPPPKVEELRKVDDVGVPAKGKAKTGDSPGTAAPSPSKRVSSGERLLRVSLMDGSIVGGKLSVASIM